MTFEIAPLSQVKKDFPEFRETILAIEEQAINTASTLWPGQAFGGFAPAAASGQFGLSSILRQHTTMGGSAIAGESGSSFFRRDWTGSSDQWVTIFDYTVPEDIIHGFAGFAFPDPTLRFSQLRIEAENKRLPMINIEMAEIFNDGGIALILRQDEGEELVVNEEERFKLRGFIPVNKGGPATIVPIGTSAFRRSDLFVRE